MSYTRSDAQKSVDATQAFHTWHSKRTWNAGHPEIDPWMRDVLISLQATLNTIAETQVKLAEQIDRNSQVLEKVVKHLKQ